MQKYIFIIVSIFYTFIDYLYLFFCNIFYSINPVKIIKDFFTKNEFKPKYSVKKANFSNKNSSYDLDRRELVKLSEEFHDRNSFSVKNVSLPVYGHFSNTIGKEQIDKYDLNVLSTKEKNNKVIGLNTLILLAKQTKEKEIAKSFSKEYKKTKL